MTAWLIALGVGLLVVHLARPRFQRRTLSAALFFANLPPAKSGTPRFSLSHPLASRPLLLHLPIFLLAATLALFPDLTFSGLPTQGYGVWVLVDGSGSMLTSEDNQTRMDLAKDQIAKALETVKAKGSDTTCYRLSRFDAEVVDLVETQNPAELKTALANLQARPLGTDLALVRARISALAQQESATCPVTHVLVFSDMPAPSWVSAEKVRVVWQQVGVPRPNTGISHLQAQRDPLTGLVRRIQVTVSAYGAAPQDARINVNGPDGRSLLTEPLTWNEEQLWHGNFQPTAPGTYTIQVQPGGAWLLDDQAALVIGEERFVWVDWRLPDTTWLQQLGWKQNPQTPHLRVAAGPPERPSDLIPTLYIGPGYLTADRPLQIRDFQDRHPLLEDLNLDALESLSLAGFALPEGFQPVLRQENGQVLLATAEQPSRIVVPGLPFNGETTRDRIATTLFFNAVRTLLHQRQAEPLFSLTEPQAAEPGPGRLAIHPGEGHTARPVLSYGRIDEVAPVTLSGEGAPVWPYLLALLVLLVLIERTLSVRGGEQWT